MGAEYQVIEATDAQRATIESWGWVRTQDSVGRDVWTKKGPCPRCGDTISKVLKVSIVAGMFPTEFQLPDTVIAESFAGPSGKASLRAQLPELVKVFCTCDVEHAAGKTGCGFYAKDIPGP